MEHFQSLRFDKLITGVICAPYNYLPVKHQALSLTFLLYFMLAFIYFFSSIALTQAWHGLMRD